MRCPRTQQECYNPECGKTTTICAYPITLNNCVESEPTIEELQKQLQESKEMIEKLMVLLRKQWSRHRLYEGEEKIEKHWQQFKTENNLQ